MKLSAKRIKNILWHFLLIGVWLALPGCNETTNQPPSDTDLIIESIKSLAPEIADAALVVSDKNNPAYRAEIDINKDPATGGAQDWNAIAMTVYKISKVLLPNPKIHEITFTFWMTDSSHVDWARVTINKVQLPTDWQRLTYQEFFALSTPLPGSVHSGHWLCDYYDTYRNIKPKGKLPSFCRR
jgi:hypothetical protein